MKSNSNKNIIDNKNAIENKNDVNNTNNSIISNVTLEDNYHLNWYVIGEEKNIKKNKIEKIIIWGKEYAFWSNGTAHLAVDNACTHRGASLSIGKIKNNNIVCPYHAYEFNSQGVLSHVPGLQVFKNTKCQNLNTYPVVVRNGWIYMNTISEQIYKTDNVKIYNEPEANNPSFKAIFINKNFNAYSRIVSENSLDVMHIGFVHSFGNAEEPSPISERPPYAVNDFPFHYKTIYNYTSGKDSMAKKLFSIKNLVIENEFILPHTTIARVIFGNSTSTVLTFAQPLNLTHSKLFVKTYRNFWYNNNPLSPLTNFVNNLGDDFTTDMMRNTIMQDKAVVESIPLDKVNGNFNMKYDKIQNVYTTLYKKLIHNISDVYKWYQ